MNENMELSLPKKSRSIPIIADSAKSIGITFSTISNSLYRLLSGNLSTFFVSGSARLITGSWRRRLRPSFQNFVEKCFCLTFLSHRTNNKSTHFVHYLIKRSANVPTIAYAIFSYHFWFTLRSQSAVLPRQIFSA